MRKVLLMTSIILVILIESKSQDRKKQGDAEEIYLLIMCRAMVFRCRLTVELMHRVNF
jgi:hypothetical protein